MGFSYSVFIQLYGFALHLGAFFNKRAAKWVEVRKDQVPKLRSGLPGKEKHIWIHCASAGEFEQAIPLIGRIRDRDSNMKIAVSFFSASGYDMYVNSKLADLFFYLPLDTKQNAIHIIDLIKPSYVIFIRGEIWRNLLLVLKRKSIPVFLVNAPASRKGNFIYQNYLKRTCILFTKIFDTDSYGNTKLERVCQIKAEPFTDSVLQSFCENSLVVILGSSWPKEEILMRDFYNKWKEKISSLKIIIAPHEFDDSKKEKLQDVFNEKIETYSTYLHTGSRILFLDRKGILKFVYRYTDVAFIGGGFEKNVHNVSEAAVYGIPVVFGPAFEKFEEINQLVSKRLAFSVDDYRSFENILATFLNDGAKRAVLKEKLDLYFSQQNSASETIVHEIYKLTEK